MRHQGIVFLIGVCLLFSAACGSTTRFAPLVAHRSWEAEAPTKVFDAAIRALHTHDFLIASSDKGSGLIATDWKQYAADDGWSYRLRLNLLVVRESDAYVALTIKSKAQARHLEDSRGEWRELEANDPVDYEGNRRMTRDLDEFFLEVQRYAGPSVQRR